MTREQKLKYISTHDNNNIKGFCGEYSFLSNMYPCKIVYKGISYKCSESAYQSTKCKREEDKKTLSLMNGYGAKKAIKNMQKLEDYIPEEKIKNMKEILLLKFSVPTFRKKLLQSGNKYIEETNYWGDTFWGISENKGDNNLGIILMEIRKNLKDMTIHSFVNKIEKSWLNKLSPFLESAECNNIYNFLKSQKTNIFPKSSNTWKAFKQCTYDNLKVVMVGLSPYHTKIGDVPVADGMMMSCSITKKLQPSLENLYNGMVEDLEIMSPIKRNCDLSYLAKQGVLLYNASLTVEEGKPGSHLKLWEPFNVFLFNLLNSYNRGLVFIFFGKEAMKLEKMVNPLLHYTKIVQHPAAASYSNGKWQHDNVFTWTNNILKQNNNEEIQWIN